MALQWVVSPPLHHIPHRSQSLLTFQQQQGSITHNGHCPVTTLAVEHSSASEGPRGDAEALRWAMQHQNRLQARLQATKAAVSKFDAQADAAVGAADVKREGDVEADYDGCGSTCPSPRHPPPPRALPVY